MNDSVIICESNTPKIRKSSLRKKAKKIVRVVNSSEDRPSRLSIRTPLRTVYEERSQSKITPCPETTSKSKRTRRSQNNLFEPPKKKRRLLDETVIISSDDDDDKSCAPVEKEIIVVDDTPQRSRPSLPRSAKKQVPKGTEKKINHPIEPQSLKNAIDEQAKDDCDDEELAVVWASAPSIKSTEPIALEPSSNNKLFFYDTKGDLKNLDIVMPEKKVTRKVKSTKEKSSKSKSIKLEKKMKKKAKSSTTKATREVLNLKDTVDARPLREIIIDGCNVAFSYSHKKEFSKMGLKLVLDYFQSRGHTVKIFLPQFHRKRDREYLEEWYRHGIVIFTPSRHIGGKKIIPYDDRFILDYATKCEGIVISSDQFRDLWHEKPEWRKTIEKRLLAPTFVGDYVMFPEDPLGRSGPSLQDFLRH